MSISRSFNLAEEIQKLLDQESRLDETNTEDYNQFLSNILDFIIENQLHVYNAQPIQKNINLFFTDTVPLPDSIQKIILTYSLESSFSLKCELTGEIITKPVLLKRQDYEPMIYQGDSSIEKKECESDPLVNLIFCMAMFSNGIVTLNQSNYFNMVDYNTCISSLSTTEEKPSPGDSKRSVNTQTKEEFTPKLVVKLANKLNERLIRLVDNPSDETKQYNFYNELKTNLDAARKNKEPIMKLTFDGLRHIRMKKRRNGLSSKQNLLSFYISLLPIISYSEMSRIINYENIIFLIPPMFGHLSAHFENNQAAFLLYNNPIGDQQSWRNRFLYFTGATQLIGTALNFGVHSQWRRVYDRHDSILIAGFRSIVSFLSKLTPIISNNVAFNILLAEKLDHKRFPESINDFSLPSLMIAFGLFLQDLNGAFSIKTAAIAKDASPIIIYGGFAFQLINTIVAIPHNIFLASTIKRKITTIIPDLIKSNRDMEEFKEENKTRTKRIITQTLNISFAIFMLFKILINFETNPTLIFLGLSTFINILILPAKTRSIRLCLNHSVLHQRPDSKPVPHIERKEDKGSKYQKKNS